MPTDAATAALNGVTARIGAAAAAAGRPGGVALLAVSKTRSVDEIAQLADAGQLAFGENYVQEAVVKRRALLARRLQWHLIGPLQSNKCRDAATIFDWIETIDRPRLLPLLDRFRPEAAPPLNLLLQINIDREPTKSGCLPEQLDALADAVAGHPRLRLRGLMAIPAPHVDPARRRASFAAMRALFDRLRQRLPGIDTLSMGMSDDFELAIAEGATQVRVGTALFGARPPLR